VSFDITFGSCLAAFLASNAKLEPNHMTNLSKIIATLIISTVATSAALADTISSPVVSSPVSSSPAPVAAATTHTLTVNVTGIRSSRGNIRAQLMKADPVAGVARGVGGNFMAAAEGSTTLTFAGLADGDYAVQMFHDEDGDGEMKTNLFGIPSEGFAFSNGARAAFGPPKFTDMKVTVKADTTTVANMAY
jgi:uncharacterized protein (DUF2141 family)